MLQPGSKAIVFYCKKAGISSTISEEILKGFRETNVILVTMEFSGTNLLYDLDSGLVESRGRTATKYSTSMLSRKTLHKHRS